MRIFKKSVYFLFESGSLDSPGGPSSNRRYSITGVLRRRVIMNFTSKGPAEAKSTITLRRIHLIRRPYAKRRGRRETMFDCPLSKTVKILDQRSCSSMCGGLRAQETNGRLESAGVANSSGAIRTLWGGIGVPARMHMRSLKAAMDPAS